MVKWLTLIALIAGSAALGLGYAPSGWETVGQLLFFPSLLTAMVQLVLSAVPASAS